MILENKLALVGYLNTKPFELGMNLSGLDQLVTKYLETPAKCFELFKKGIVDISLCPIGALVDYDNNNYDIITDYCIGCDGVVRTVCLFSHDNIEDIHTIHLDNHSRTSALLIKILMKNHFKKKVDYKDGVKNYIDNLPKGHALLLIGDKVFENENRFQHIIDLGSSWKDMTNHGLPFAIWIAKKGTEKSLIEKLNESLAQGVQNIDKVITRESKLNNINLSEYFSKNISYDFNTDKKEALNLYTSFAKNL